MFNNFVWVSLSGNRNFYGKNVDQTLVAIVSIQTSGKKILVTGAGTGIGRQLSVELSKCGCIVYAINHDVSNKNTVSINFSNIISINLDLLNWDQTRKELERLDVMDGLVNCAGVSCVAYAALDCPNDYINEILNTSLLCAVNCTQIIAKKMISSNVKGSVVSISGVPGHCEFRHALPFNVSKAAVDMMSMQFALELQSFGIRVNTISPKLEIVKDIQQRERTAETTVVNNKPRIYEDSLNKAVTTIMYLLSEQSAGVTGKTFVIDGSTAPDIFKPL